MLNAFHNSIHAYTEKGWVDDIQFVRNVDFNAGRIAGADVANIIQSTGMRPVIDGNMTWGGRDHGISPHSNFGKIINNYFADINARPASCNTNCTVTNNTIIPQSATKPSENKIFLLPDLYEPGRLTLVIYNWKKLRDVDVVLPNDLLLEKGQAFEIRDVQNYFKGTTNGSTEMGSAIIPNLQWAPGMTMLSAVALS